MDTSHAHAAIPMAPTLIVNAINTFTALLSRRSIPLSTCRLSCTDASGAGDFELALPDAVFLRRLLAAAVGRPAPLPCPPDVECGWMRTCGVCQVSGCYRPQDRETRHMGQAYQEA